MTSVLSHIHQMGYMSSSAVRAVNRSYVKTMCAAFYFYTSENSITHFHTSETKYANFFFAFFLTSHYCNQINFPLRFHISHARPQAAGLKRFASLRDVPEYSTRISDDDVVSNGNTHDTNIFNFTDTSPHTYK